jgi:predicted secreted Zn-dependent protease
VRAGESLGGIAFAYGVDPEDLRYWNAETYPSLRSIPEIVAGWVLKVSGPPRPTPTPRPERTPGVLVPLPAPNQPAPAGSSDLVALPMLTISVWNAQVEYFAISGTSPAELLASAKANANHPHGDSAMAYVVPSQSFDYSTTGPACAVSQFSVMRSYTVHAPQWVAPAVVHPALLGWWQAILDHVAWHEEQHVRIFETNYGTLERELLGQPCEVVQAIIDNWSASLNAAQEAFDASDANWTPPRYTGPADW